MIGILVPLVIIIILLTLLLLSLPMARVRAGPASSPEGVPCGGQRAPCTNPASSLSCSVCHVRSRFISRLD